MEHKIIQAAFKTMSGLMEVIELHEQDGWSVAAMGETLGGNLLILVKDGVYYVHQAVPIFWKTRRKLEAFIREKERENWQVCAMGECFGNLTAIMKRRREIDNN